MFDAAHDLKNRLESEAMEYYEKWDLVDTCGWLIPDDAEVELFMADRAKEDEQEAATVKILQRLKSTIDAVPKQIVERTEEVYNSVGHERYEQITFRVIETLGFGFDPTDATEFVKVLNDSLMQKPSAT